MDTTGRERRLWAACEEQLQGLQVQRPFTIEAFCEALSIRRSRRIVLHQLPDDGGVKGPCGLWLAFRSEDHIWHAPATSQRHRTQVILHEIGHMLLQHTNDFTSSSLLAALPPEIAPSRIRAVFGRTHYATEQELDAELTASILRNVIDTLPTAPSTTWSGLLTQVDDTMAHPRRNRQ
ncbi:secondary metabolite protein [Streptomyces sp. NPDC001443]